MRCHLLGVFNPPRASVSAGGCPIHARSQSGSTGCALRTVFSLGARMGGPSECHLAMLRWRQVARAPCGSPHDLRRAVRCTDEIMVFTSQEACWLSTVCDDRAPLSSQCMWW
jgi:hypothetical protein